MSLELVLTQDCVYSMTARDCFVNGGIVFFRVWNGETIDKKMREIEKMMKNNSNLRICDETH